MAIRNSVKNKFIINESQRRVRGKVQGHFRGVHVAVVEEETQTKYEEESP